MKKPKAYCGRPGRDVAFWIVLCLAFAAAALTGCRAKPPETPKPAQPEKVSICLGGAPGIFPLLTQEKGFFASEGLDVEVKKFKTTTEGLEHFFNGECDLSSISETAVVMKSFERNDFSILATYTVSDNSTAILADRRRGIERPRDLKGKRILVPKWSSNHYFLYMFLARHGMKEKDVIVAPSSTPDAPDAFSRGAIDAYCATRIAMDKARVLLGENTVVFDAPGLCLASFNLVAKKDFIKARPETLKKALSAMLKTEDWIKANRAAAIRAAAASQNMQEQVMEKLWDDYQWRVQLSKPMLLSLEQEAKWFIEGGFSKSVTVPNYLDYISQDTLRSLKPEVVNIR